MATKWYRCTKNLIIGGRFNILENTRIYMDESIASGCSWLTLDE
jgi:hypothetical protein